MSLDSLEIYLPDEQSTVETGRLLGASLQGGEVIYLHGDLGAGKTTFCRGVLAAWGYRGVVKSPTYTLVEPYVLEAIKVYHFDLYRLGSPEELEFIGIRDYFDGSSLALIEWPERGAGVLSEADLHIEILLFGRGRKLRCQAQTERAANTLETMRLAQQATEP